MPDVDARVRLAALALAILLIGVGILYEQLGRRRDNARFPQVGRSVDIGGRSLNISCLGQGTPTVIFDSGGGVPGYGWVSVQRQIARSTRACWYDRAGYGWSDPVAAVQTSAGTARDLHQLLRAADVAPPYVFVGHSLGGFNMRVYNGLYADEIAGAVLIDASHEDMEARIPRWRRRFRVPLMTDVSSVAGPLLARMGILRLSTSQVRTDPPPLGFTVAEWTTVLGLAWTPKMRAQTMAESFDESAAQARAAGTFGDRPLIILTAGKHAPLRSASAVETAEDQRAWEQLQRELAQLSSRGVQRLVANSDHMIPFEAPDTVVRAIDDVLHAVWQR
jgi:pimeloyl-ACP methyl ester carboxylesterase